MPESALLINPDEIDRVQVRCENCAAVWAFSLTRKPTHDPMGESLGEQTETRCIWCHAELPRSLRTAFTDLRRSLSEFSGAKGFSFRLVVDEDGRN